MASDVKVSFLEFLADSGDLDTVIAQVSSDQKGVPPFVEDVYGCLLQIIRASNVSTILRRSVLDTDRSIFSSDVTRIYFSDLVQIGEEKNYNTALEKGKNFLVNLKQKLPDDPRLRNKDVQLQFSSAETFNPLEITLLTSGVSFSMVLFTCWFGLSSLRAQNAKIEMTNRIVEILSERAQFDINDENRRLALNGLVRTLDSSSDLKSNVTIVLKSGQVSTELRAGN